MTRKLLVLAVQSALAQWRAHWYETHPRHAVLALRERGL